MKRIAVLGSTGMAGHVISQYMQEHGHDVYRAAINEKAGEKSAPVDVSNLKTLDEWLEGAKPDVVINCIGLLNKACDAKPDLAVALNSLLPRHLEARYKGTPVKIIHMSTDCVFSGERGSYSETDAPDGKTFYDRSKALGEINNDKDLTFRMSIVGPDTNENGIGLFNWFMRQSGPINGYGKAIWTGVTTVELARAMFAAIEQNLTGLYHLVPACGGIDKYSLICLFKQAFERDDIDITRKDDVVVDKSLVNHRTDFDFTVQDYAAQVADMRAWVDAHREWYPRY